MPRRVLCPAVLVLLIGVALAAPAQAKAGDIDHLVITGPNGEPVEILGAMLDGQLSPVEQTDLYWPLLFGKNKGNVAPDGDLGRRYDITYVLTDAERNPVEVSEAVYLEADPPVAFAPRGQTHELYPGDVRAVPWGWRPFPGRGANALMFLMNEAARPPGPPVMNVISPAAVAVVAVPLLLLVGGAWFILRHRRSVRTGEPAEASR